MRFVAFLAVVAVIGILVLYVIGDRRQPARVVIEQEVELIEKGSGQ